MTCGPVPRAEEPGRCRFWSRSFSAAERAEIQIHKRRSHVEARGVAL